MKVSVLQVCCFSSKLILTLKTLKEQHFFIRTINLFKTFDTVIQKHNVMKHGMPHSFFRSHVKISSR